MPEPVKAKTATMTLPWGSSWPEGELCRVQACPVCASTDRKILHEELVDNVFYCAPGKWTSWCCSDCGSAYLDPCPSPTSIHRAYETYYTHEAAGPLKDNYATLGQLRKLRRRLTNAYTNWRFSTRETPTTALGVLVLAIAWPFRKALAREYRHLPRLPAGGGRVLDIGCGNGSFLRIANNCGWDVTGLDPDPKAVANCRSQGLNVLLGGVEQFHGSIGMFDVITMSHVIEHVHDPIGVMKTCFRLLKPGGRLWLETPNINSLGHRQYGRNWRGLEPPRHLVLFNRHSLTRALSNAGFARVEDKGGMSPLPGMTRASEAIKQGRPIDDHVLLSTRQKWWLRRNKLLLAVMPASKEFLTMIAFKN